MTIYDEKDQSVSGQTPAILVEFSGPIIANYTTAEKPVHWRGLEFSPGYIKHGALEQTNELPKQRLELTIAMSSPIVQLFIAESPSTSVNVKLYRYIQGCEEFRFIWSGSVVSIEAQPLEQICILNCEPIFTRLSRAGLRRNYQPTCPYTVYDACCGKSPVEYTVHGTVLSVNGLRLMCSAAQNKADNYFTGGILKFGKHLRFIMQQTSNGFIHLASPIYNLKRGEQVDLIAGCNKTFMECHQKFHNANNFGGFPFLPLRNPFAGDSLHS